MYTLKVDLTLDECDEMEERLLSSPTTSGRR
jgi:hypothetical protein